MSVPAFDSRGFIPPYIGQDGATPDRSPYEATMTDIVTALGTTTERRDLLRGLLAYRQLLTRLGYTHGLQFVDGTFVEDVESRESRSPGDVDVFSYLVTPDKFKRDPALWVRSGLAEWQ